MSGSRPTRRGMRGPRRRRFEASPSLLTLESRLLLAADVLTYHNDVARTGQNLAETTLNPDNVNVDTFGKVGQVSVDGAVYAQPLIKTGVAVPGQGTHDLLFVATQHDSVYAFDANTLAPIWHDSFINPGAGVTPVPAEDVGSNDIFPEIGITGTPVIDPATSTIYVVAKTRTQTGATPTYALTLHALDLATGREKLGGPVMIQASVPGVGSGSVRGRVAFQPLIELQRSGLLLSHGVVYIAFASHGDNGPYHGWLLGYSARTLRLVSAFNTTPNGAAGGIWMSGGAPAADGAGNIYVAVGNGTFKDGPTPRNFGDAVLKLNPRRRLAVLDYFIPNDQARLSALDKDFGSGGVLILPDQPGAHRRELITGGKDGRLFVINRDRMGRFSAKANHVVQAVPEAISADFATPAYFNGHIYAAGVGPQTNMKQYRITNGVLDGPPASGAYFYGFPGSTPSISAQGNTHGIVWSLDNGAFRNGGPAVLRAYDARDVAIELYDSTQDADRDAAGPAVKFTVPTVANGRVYVGGNGVVSVYGLLNS
jgi:hypothetical protein